MAKIRLRLRHGDRRIVLPARVLDGIDDASDEAVAKIARPLLKAGESDKVHDLEWLRAIINWVPEGGLSMTEMAKWLKLASRISELKEDRGYTLTLSPFHTELIWNRLTDPGFKLNMMTAQFREFIIEFQEAAGKHFDEEGPDEIEIEEDEECATGQPGSATLTG